VSAGLALLAKVPIFFALGLYQHPRASPLPRQLQAIVVATAAAALVMLGAALAIQATGILPGISPRAVLLDLPIGLALITGIRLIGFGLSEKGAPSMPTHAPGDEFRTHWRRWLTEAAIYFGVVGSALAIYVTTNRIAFGSWIPISAVIKRWWGSQLHTIYDGPAANLSSFFGFGLRTTMNSWQPASEFFLWLSGALRGLMPGLRLRDERDIVSIGLVLVAALLILLCSGRAALGAITKLGLVPLFVGNILQVLSYTATAYSGYKEWYWIGQWILVSLVAGLVLHLLMLRLQTRLLWRRIAFSASALASLILAVNLGSIIIAKMPHGRYPADRPYMEVLTFLEGHTPSGAIIGMTGGGNIGYLLRDRVIVNMDGLINSTQYFLALRAGNGATYLTEQGVGIVFANPGLLAQAPYQGQFAPYLERFDSYGGKALLWLLSEPKYQDDP
jgi:hypothetical protein